MSIGYPGDYVLSFWFDDSILVSKQLWDALRAGIYPWQTRLAISTDGKVLHIIDHNEAVLYGAAVKLGSCGYKPNGCTFSHYHREIYDKKADWVQVDDKEWHNE